MKEKTKKFLCIKDTIGFKKGEEIAMDSVYEKFQWVSYNEITEYFQEEKEEEKVLPRWKVWDYVVKEITDNSNLFIKIFSISGYISDNCWFLYNWVYISSDFRNPTQEELKLYFR